MMSVRKNIRSIFFTFIFALILVYLFSIVGFAFFQDDFLIEAQEVAAITDDSETGSCSAEINGCPEPDEGPTTKQERACDSLIMCLVTGERPVMDRFLPRFILILPLFPLQFSIKD